MIGRILIGNSRYSDGEEFEGINFTLLNSSCFNYGYDAGFDESSDGIRRVAYSIVAPLIVVVGILGNILNLTVLTKPFLKGGTRLFLTALATSDLSVMITVIPMVFRLNRYHGTFFEAAFFHAHLELFLTNIFITASVLIVVCLTVERYFSVCHPTMFRSLHTKRNARIGILWCYAIAIFISFPLTVLKKVCIIRNPAKEHCVTWEFQENTMITNTVYWSLYLWLAEFLIRLGPCVILAVLNILIIKKFRQVTARRKILLAALTHSKDPSEVQRTKKTLRNKKFQVEKRLVVLLRSIVVLFFVTMTPSSILSLVYSEMHESAVAFQVFRAAANNLELANFALNFYVYFLCSKEFRLALINVFTGCCANDDEQSEIDVGDVATNTN